MKILIVHEGVHEIERNTEHDLAAPTGDESNGALRVLVDRLLQHPFEPVFDRLANGRIHPFHGKGQGYYKKAVRWILEAVKREVDALILLIDRDKHERSVDEIDRAQEKYIEKLPRALGVAIRTFDAWMLADERALTTALQSPIQRQPDPEGISDPKAQCERLRDDSGSGIPLRDLYRMVAENADVGAITERCPRGFKPFADRVRNLRPIAG